MIISERETLIGNISDDSKSATGCRLRLDFARMSLQDLRDDAAYWSARAEEAFEDWKQQEECEAAYEAAQEAIEAAMPTAYDEIQDRLEGF